MATELTAQLRRIVGDRYCLLDEASRLVYARDASHLELGRPWAVVLPADAGEVRAVVARCAAHGTPWVVRGAGTGLSGGAVPADGSVVISLARLKDAGEIDLDSRRLRAGVGLTNVELSTLAALAGLCFAPDPSSQRASTLGGNIAENAGGPHCLAVGVTLNHLEGLEFVGADGRAWSSGMRWPGLRQIDLLPLLCGSEGRLGVVTAADVRLSWRAPAVATLLADFPRLDDATAAVVGMLGAGLQPVAVELVGRRLLRAVEQAFAFGFPDDVDAVLVVEFEGAGEAVAEDAAAAARFMLAGGAREVRRAADEEERQRLWRCRKKAFGAVGRIAPAYVTVDVVVPLDRLPVMMREVEAIGREHGVDIVAACHAGDGNLHPGVCFDDRDTASVERAARAADAIAERALDYGGSVTGEHGVGIEKQHLALRQIDAVAADLMHGICDLFDPRGLCNPGKALPPPGAACGPLPEAPSEICFKAEALTVTAPTGASVGEVQAEASRLGLYLPVGLAVAGRERGLGADLTVGDVVMHLGRGPALLAAGGVRDCLLEVWAECGDGRRFRAGAPVFKNVVGLDLARLLCGSAGYLATLRAATFQLRARPEAFACWRFAGPALSTDSLRSLERLLDRRQELGPAPAVILDDEGDRSSVTVVAAGRRRPWDLDAREGELRAWAVASGIEVVSVRQDEWAVITEVDALDLPRWCRTCDAWRLLRPERAATVPPARGIRQGNPRCMWIPSEDGADDVVVAGRSWSPLVEPPPKVPLAHLRGLKRLFDPAGSLGGPAWLLEEEEGA